MPPLAAVQAVSQAVAVAVARAAVAEGLARHAINEAEALARLEACRWRPAYRPVVAAPGPPLSAPQQGAPIRAVSPARAGTPRRPSTFGSVPVPWASSSSSPTPSRRASPSW